MVPHVKTRFGVHLARVRSLEIREMGAYVWHRLRAALYLAQKVVRPVEAGKDKYCDLLLRHRLEKSDTRVALIQCDQTRQNLVHAWRYLVGDRIRDYPLAGDHEQILNDENVEIMAQKIETILADFDIQSARPKRA